MWFDTLIGSLTLIIAVLWYARWVQINRRKVRRAEIERAMRRHPAGRLPGGRGRYRVVEDGRVTVYDPNGQARITLDQGTSQLFLTGQS